MTITLSHVQNQDVHIFHLSGSLSQADTTELSDQLQAFMDRPSRVLLNLEKVDFIDSSGIATLIACHRKIANRQGSFCICGVGQNLKQVIRLAGVDTLLKIYENTEEALHAMRP